MTLRAARPLLEDMLAYAREAVEVVGEAAAQVPPRIRDALQQVPFRQAADMRNKLVHGYGQISPHILSNTVREDLPQLIAQLEEALAGRLADEA